jgi:Kef-type K+ transport system membrane component KefB
MNGFQQMHHRQIFGIICLQVGVQLLLFGLGLEFSFEKMKEVGSVAVLGGALQIVLLIALCAAAAVSIGGALSEGLFFGALISMSSTSVVVKSLGDRSGDRASNIIIGTLILQDCSVGLMFALMPVLSSLNNPKTVQAGGNLEARGEIVILVLQVFIAMEQVEPLLWCPG